MCQTCCIKRLPSEKRGTENRAGRRDSKAGIRVEKVLEVRQQLGEGTYSVADRVDKVVEKIIKDLS